MKTIIEHLDDLDRMIDAGNTPKHELRSQVAFIQREVSALQTNYDTAVDANAKLQEELTKLKNSNAKRNDAAWDALRKESDDYHKMLRSHQLNHDV